MLWSLVKVLIFVAAIAAVAFGAVQLLSMDGGVQITAAGTEYTLGALETIILIVVLGLLGWLVIKLLGFLIATLKFINGDETAISRYFNRNRERKGYQALSEGMMALASGEGSVAMSKANKAERYLNKPELTNLISAQAAEMSGDTRKAQEVYKRLLKNDATRFVGVRGIMKQKLAEGDTDTALALAEKAFGLKPKHEETQDVLLRLQAQKEDWSGARETLGAKLKYGSLPRDVHKRRDAVLAVARATALKENGETEKAAEVAIEANRLSPELIPAAVLAAVSYVEQSKPRYAARVIKRAWTAQPHPDLAAAYAAIEPNEEHAARIKRFGALTKIHPDHPETKMLLAELNIAAEDFPAARRALGDLAETTPTTRSLALMAAVERGEGSDDSVVRGWLTRALTAPRGPQWVCDVCNSVHAVWSATCDVCGAFDTLKWRDVPHDEASMPNANDMLPLLVSKPEESAAEVPIPVVTEEDMKEAVEAELAEETQK
ncbi:MAG: heme biosynthesis HemY N-terminal domain-containing protein [Pseudomonadota bacterium]